MEKCESMPKDYKKKTKKNKERKKINKIKFIKLGKSPCPNCGEVHYMACDYY